MKTHRHSSSAIWLSDTHPSALGSHGDEADAGPGVEPAVQELQLEHVGLKLEEPKGGAEEKPTPIVRH
jgi:hypothetical protein